MKDKLFRTIAEATIDTCKHHEYPTHHPLAGKPNPFLACLECLQNAIEEATRLAYLDAVDITLYADIYEQPCKLPHKGNRGCQHDPEQEIRSGIAETIRARVPRRRTK